MFHFKKFNQKISDMKSLIDTDTFNSKWDKMKKIANPYEMVYTTFNKKKRGDGHFILVIIRLLKSKAKYRRLNLLQIQLLRIL